MLTVLASIFLLLRFINGPFKLLHTLGAHWVWWRRKSFLQILFHSSWEGCAHAIAAFF
jgi:hypothetical protein